MSSIEVRIRRKYEAKVQILEFNWNKINNKNNIEFSKQTLVLSIQTFQKNWNAFLNRFSTFTNDQFIKSRREIDASARKKSVWLANETGWDSFLIDGNNQLTELIIISDSEFISLPLELLTIGNSYIGDLVPITRKIVSTSKQKIKHSYGTNSLFIFDDTSGLGVEKSVIRERENLQSLVDNKLNVIELTNSKTSNSRFKEEISNSKYFHYSGHLELSSFTFLNEHPITSDELSTWNLSNLELVFLNGCNGLLSSHETKSLGTAFLESGVGTVVGFSYYIPTKMAEEIGEYFWKSYLKSKSLSKAVKEVKLRLSELSNPYRFAFQNLGVPLENQPTNLKRKRKNFALLSFVLIVSMFIFKNFLIKESPSDLKQPEKISTEESKKPSSMKIKHSHKSTNEESKVLTSPIIQSVEVDQTKKASVIAQIQKFKSTTLKDMLTSYLEEDHIIYNEIERLSIVRTYISKNISEENLEKLFRQELGKIE